MVTGPAHKCCGATVSLSLQDKAPCSAQLLLIPWHEFSKSLLYPCWQLILSLGWGEGLSAPLDRSSEPGVLGTACAKLARVPRAFTRGSEAALVPELIPPPEPRYRTQGGSPGQGAAGTGGAGQRGGIPGLPPARLPLFPNSR